MRSTRKESHRAFKKPYYLLGAVALFMNPALLVAQEAEEQEIEEVVVTGSFIRNSQFTNSSPVVTISQDDIQNSGASSFGEYLRDLPYMENIDTVASILDSGDGRQDSNSARFNLRGLGTESTLTLVDGRRAVNEGAVSALLPGIAQRSVEILTDGGAALYGSDAVAGVANLIPYKEYDGVKGRVYYKRDGEGGTENYTAEMMAGRTFSNGLNWVGAIEYSKRTPLLVSERPKYQEYYNQDSAYGNPGSFRNRFYTSFYQDPSCGTFNDGNEDISQPNAYPSGLPDGNDCRLFFGEWQDYGRLSNNVTVFNNFNFQVTDWLTLEFQASHNRRDSNWITSPSSLLFTNTSSLPIASSHPANPFGTTVYPYRWRPFAKIGTRPSQISDSGSLENSSAYQAESYKFGGTFDIVGTTWVGESWIGYQEEYADYHVTGIRLSKMQRALAGEGGPNTDEYFNPFGSADPRSPFYVAGVTDNSQELVDWLLDDVTYRNEWNRLKYFDLILNGELFEVPSGVVKAAVGGQIRSHKEFDVGSTKLNPLTRDEDNLYVTATAPLEPREDRESGVRAIFAELEVPVIEGVGIKAAVRHEEFYNIGFSATKPKVSLLWEPLDTLSIRASYGESFLAPRASQLRPLAKDVCTPVRSGTDPLTNLPLEGADSCTSGNPSLRAEESEIINIGFTWLPSGALDGLRLSVDYQEIEYIDRIDSLASAEVTRRELNRYLSANNLTADQFDASNPTDAAAGIAWALANPNELITRDATGAVTDIYRAPINLSSQFVEGMDIRLSYNFELEDLGNFTASIGGNYYTRWDYAPDEFIGLINGRGLQNAPTNLAPPLPKYKANASLSWYRGDHSASMTVRHIAKVKFDQEADDLTLNYEAFAPNYIRPITKVDARYSYSFDAFDTESRLTVGIQNLFDRDAQRLPQYGGLETRIDDPFGRQFYMSVDFEL
ncbi:MAG: TonB-dependent receptor [Pseudohongiellaceae bacterium]|nr:TonB-dependent receptor [Pseudohongiellaceae bacterium]